jgi:hypothetical protein
VRSGGTLGCGIASKNGINLILWHLRNIDLILFVACSATKNGESSFSQEKIAVAETAENSAVDIFVSS